uniref:Replication-associated protein n=1 Tax=Myotis capaccinii feces associated cyclovirus 2 TaxID=3139989 RepID=A0AAU6S515_9CIRC
MTALLVMCPDTIERQSASLRSARVMSGTVRRFCFTWNNYTEADYNKAKLFIQDQCKYGIIGQSASLRSARVMSGTVRRFCFTWNNYTEADYNKAKLFIQDQCKYGIIGKEIAPATGTIHLQGFCNLHKPMRFNAIKKCLSNTIHIEKANGSDLDNQKYCSKAGEIFETGEPQSQGKRNDLQTMVDYVNNQPGICNIENIAREHPTVFIKYHRGIKEWLRLHKPIQPRFEKTEVFYYYGSPGTGKSKSALEEATAALQEGETVANDIYYKPRGLWWDGYMQQRCIIIDDFYGWIKYDEMLKIMDRYPYKVQIKGGFEEFTSKKIWITTNVDTDLLYKFEGYNVTAFERRLTIKKFFT